ncbi:hypothetical protein [Nonomuraea sp. JJY05]|uniref:hypothetical protein n=1 Tax=Nonomuraea sp. JJY05 TaxID=3350255 RepID=UPI00373E55F3
MIEHFANTRRRRYGLGQDLEMAGVDAEFGYFPAQARAPAAGVSQPSKDRTSVSGRARRTNPASSSGVGSAFDMDAGYGWGPTLSRNDLADRPFTAIIARFATRSR